MDVGNPLWLWAEHGQHDHEIEGCGLSRETSYRGLLLAGGGGGSGVGQDHV